MCVCLLSVALQVCVRPVEVRALRVLRWGMEEATRFGGDNDTHGLFYHPFPGVFTTTPDPPTQAELEDWLPAPASAHTVASTGASCCVICRTAAAGDDAVCKFCGADRVSGVGAADEPPPPEETVTAPAPLPPKQCAGTLACVCALCVCVCVAVRVPCVPVCMCLCVCAGRPGVLKVDLPAGKPTGAHNGITAPDPEFTADARAARHRKPQRDTALAAQLFGLSQDTAWHRTQARRAAGPPHRKPVPYAHTGGHKPLMVLDAPNVGMRAGRGAAFLSAGVLAALAYYQRRGHRVVAFLPESYVDGDRIAGLRRAEKVCVRLCVWLCV